MKRHDVFDVERGCLFQHSLHRRAELPDDIEIVTRGLVGPAWLRIFGHSEGAEAVGAEQSLFRSEVSHHNLGPVDHRSHNESEAAAVAEIVSIAFADCYQSAGIRLGIKKMREHRCRTRADNKRHPGIAVEKRAQRAAVIRLEVLTHQSRRPTSFKRFLNVSQPLKRKSRVDTVDNDRTLAEYYV